jgi:hypothetical protein
MLRRAWWHGFRSAWSDEGYAVRLIGLRKGLEYSEGDHIRHFDVETASTEKASWIIYDTKRGWEPPYQDEPLSVERREQIRHRIISALEFMKLKAYLE